MAISQATMPPEATLALPAAALPFEVVPSVTACEPLEFLTELIHDGLNRHQTLSHKLAVDLVDAAEGLVRVGWALQDAKNYLTQPGSYQRWVHDRFPTVSVGWLLRLRKLSAAFSRDLVDVKQRERLGVTVEGLPAVNSSIHLRTQLADAAPRSLNHLFRMTGSWLLSLPMRPQARGLGCRSRAALRYPPGVASHLRSMLVLSRSRTWREHSTLQPRLLCEWTIAPSPWTSVLGS